MNDLNKKYLFLFLNVCFLFIDLTFFLFIKLIGCKKEFSCCVTTPPMQLCLPSTLNFLIRFVGKKTYFRKKSKICSKYACQVIGDQNV